MANTYGVLCLGILRKWQNSLFATERYMTLAACNASALSEPYVCTAKCYGRSLTVNCLLMSVDHALSIKRSHHFNDHCQCLENSVMNIAQYLLNSIRAADFILLIQLLIRGSRFYKVCISLT